MPTLKQQDTKQRDIKTLKRIVSIQKSSNILRKFYDKGFKNFNAIEAIILNYYPKTLNIDLYNFWHFRTFDTKIADLFEDVFEKLKNE